LGAQDTVSLDLEAARRVAFGQSPAFAAERERLAAARGVLREARTYPHNPQIDLEVPTARFDGDSREYEASLAQEVEWAGQPGLRSRAAEFGLRRSGGDLADAARALRANVDRAYYAALAADRRVEIAEMALALNERLITAVRTQLREGEISKLEANLAEVESGRSRALAMVARGEALAATLELGHLLGLPPDVELVLDPVLPAIPDPETLEPESLVARALVMRPDLSALEAAVEESNTQVRLARREAIPNITLGALAERQEDDSQSQLGVILAVPLPLWNRNQGVVDQRRADARRTAFERDAARIRIQAEVLQAFRNYAATAAAAAALENEVLGPARETRGLLETAHREGKIDLTTLLLVRNQLLDAELAYWETWLDWRGAWSDLESAAGETGPFRTNPDQGDRP
jgi:cobalt-zinc-cadmium efflux system outer membrane protein